MTLKKFHRHLVSLSVAFVLGLAIVLPLQIPIQAQLVTRTAKEYVKESVRINFVTSQGPITPSDRPGTPRDRQPPGGTRFDEPTQPPQPGGGLKPPPNRPRAPGGSNPTGGTRDNGKCPQDKLNPDDPLLTLLTPTQLTPADKIELTPLQHPTFQAYVPQTSAIEAEFTLTIEGQDSGYKQRFPLENTPGVVSFKLPSEAPPLEVGKTYTWSFALICSPEDRTKDIVRESQIELIQPPQQK